MGETYKLYLRDTLVLQHKHVAALSKKSDEVTRLLGNNRDILPNIVPLDDEMGNHLWRLQRHRRWTWTNCTTRLDVPSSLI